MANSATYNHTKVHFTEGSAPTTPDAGERAIYAKSDGMYEIDDAGTETKMADGSAAHIADTTDAHDASAISVLDTAANFTGTDVEAVLAELQDNIDGVVGGASFTGQPLVVLPPDPIGVHTASTNATAGLAFAIPIIIPGAMKVRGLQLHIASAGAGSIEWGVFDYSASPTAATKLAGGSGAPASTGYQLIAAASAPVSVAAGAYMLVVKQPDANPSTISSIAAAGAVAPFNQIFSTYTWDDTPDFTSASWTTNQTILRVFLEGDIDGSGTRWG